jgi:hypothetical protein
METSALTAARAASIPNFALPAGSTMATAVRSPALAELHGAATIADRAATAIVQCRLTVTALTRPSRS